MEPKFQTSFIPKRPIVSTSGTGFTPVHTTNIFSVIATILFVATLVVSGGLFFYKNVLTNQIALADKSLNDTRVAFQPEKINELIATNSRIIATKNLLNQHIVLSQLLILLQNLTVKKIRFTGLTFASKTTENNKSPSLSLTGEAQSYNSIAEQQGIFSKNDFIKNSEFSSFNLGDNGNIKFKFFTNLDPLLFSYKAVLQSISQ